MSITRNVSPVISSYILQNTPVQRTHAQKDRGILVCKDLKWNCHVLVVASKANRMLGFIPRSTREVKIQSTWKALYTALVMSNLSYSSQVWAHQSVKLIEISKRVQLRATKYILSLPYSTDVSYKERPRLTELIPLCYWQEYLDLVYTYKSIVNNTDTQFKISKTLRVTRHSASSKTVTFENNFYSRASRAFNTLPEYLRDNTQCIAFYFGSSLSVMPSTLADLTVSKVLVLTASAGVSKFAFLQNSLRSSLHLSEFGLNLLAFDQCRTWCTFICKLLAPNFGTISKTVVLSANFHIADR